jgi:alpha-tubulin suppressor-like RCC1 family protein
LSLVVGGSQELTAILRDQLGNPLTGRPVTWITSDAMVATVSATGLVSGISQGPATITASAEGRTGNAAATVSVVTFTSVVAGGAHTCALTTTGAAYCWGRGESGQLGIALPSITCPTDAGPFPCSRTPVAVAGGLEFVQLAAGGAYTCGLTNDGSAYCWGTRLGGAEFAPVAVATALKFSSIDAGTSHACALTSAGAAYCWGVNLRGQLGDGTTQDRPAPVAVTGGHTFQLIAAGGFNIGQTCALIGGGDAYCWGDNERGQLGIAAADLIPHPIPVPVLAPVAFTGLTAGLGRHACGLTSTGAAYCWGENTFGALGNASMADSTVPVAVAGGLAFTQLTAGGFIGHTCGWTANGTAYCWGENERGQVGDGSTTDRLVPSPVAGGLAFSSLDAGFRHACGRATTGAVYCWGSGGAGQLGTNSTTQSNVPMKVVGQP